VQIDHAFRARGEVRCARREQVRRLAADVNALFLLGVRSLFVSDKLRVPMWYDLIWFSFGTFLALNPIAAATEQKLPAER